MKSGEQKAAWVRELLAAARDDGQGRPELPETALEKARTALRKFWGKPEFLDGVEALVTVSQQVRRRFAEERLAAQLLALAVECRDGLRSLVSVTRAPKAPPVARAFDTRKPAGASKVGVGLQFVVVKQLDTLRTEYPRVRPALHRIVAAAVQMHGRKGGFEGLRARGHGVL